MTDDQKTARGHQLFPSATWVPGIKLRSGFGDKCLYLLNHSIGLFVCWTIVSWIPAKQRKMISCPWTSCLHHLRAGIAGVHHREQNPGFHTGQANTPPTGLHPQPRLMSFKAHAIPIDSPLRPNHPIVQYSHINHLVAILVIRLSTVLVSKYPIFCWMM